MTLKHLSVLAEDDDDPMLSAVNLVDVFLVLVVALLTAVAVQSQTSANESVTIIRNAGQPDMEVVVREQGKEVRFKGAGSAAQGQGVRAGVAYKLEDGNIVYIPETGAAPASVSASGAGGAATPAPAKP
ncbi:hypothetical protein SAMN04489707_102816 [Paenacidovorax caeni]|uniref:DUF2149 domain-containing protein n=1 Tax=Paenacidovorax caeni TaxID=343013 RepID=A0A1I7JN32_9BURK|nr:DUF2149 domain-containing protein [Paenacidovorax caeni]SFU86581.1 hypothetical protein SAMN04489707_102816 [Paenacidovorax caeni]